MCICCKNNNVENVFTVENRGYGSIFDLMNFSIPLCKECIKKFKVEKKWFTENSNSKNEYMYEGNIANLLLNIYNICYVDENMFE